MILRESTAQESNRISVFEGLAIPITNPAPDSIESISVKSGSSRGSNGAVEDRLGVVRLLSVAFLPDCGRGSSFGDSQASLHKSAAIGHSRGRRKVIHGLDKIKEPHAFTAGDSVRAKSHGVSGHTRLPANVRGRRGRIEAFHGAHIFPEPLGP